MSNTFLGLAQNLMNYWWVNHKQTFNEELKGGYIWSPKTNKNGAINQTYINLTHVQQNEIIFSYANGEIKAIGRAEQTAIENPRPPEFGNMGGQWDRVGWLVKVDWTLLNRPIKPKEYIEKISPLLPQTHSPIQSNGNGNQGCYLAEISRSLGELLIAVSPYITSLQPYRMAQRLR